MAARQGARVSFSFFAKSQTALLRIRDDTPKLGQDIAIQVMLLAGALYIQDNRLPLRWIPGHRGVTELAGHYVRRVAEAGVAIRENSHFTSCISAASLKRERAVMKWQAEEVGRNRGGGFSGYRTPRPGPRLE